MQGHKHMDEIASAKVQRFISEKKDSGLAPATANSKSGMYCVNDQEKSRYDKLSSALTPVESSCNYRNMDLNKPDYCSEKLGLCVAIIRIIFTP